MHNDQNLNPTRTSIYSNKSENKIQDVKESSENDQDQVKNEDDD